jgi:hypothetical protein
LNYHRDIDDLLGIVLRNLVMEAAVHATAICSAFSSWESAAAAAAGVEHNYYRFPLVPFLFNSRHKWQAGIESLQPSDAAHLGSRDIP